MVRRFLAQFHNILMYVLLAAGFVKLMVGPWLEATTILRVVIINATPAFLVPRFLVPAKRGMKLLLYPRTAL
jgi:hypothetical protein